MSTPSGTFVWYELIAGDPAAAESFYRTVIGWQARDAEVPGMTYRILSAGERPVAGLVGLSGEGASARPGWLGYIGVDDVDAASARIAAASGAILHAPADIPGVGRFAVVTDPQGALFALFQGEEQPMPPVPEGAPGHVAWHELHARDEEAAFAFYAGQFGWTRADALDMGPKGLYQMFATGGPPVGGVMASPDAAPFWLFYITVESLDAALDRAARAGGHTVQDPTEIPGGQWIAQCRDPEGTPFALVAPRR
ncbi:VOC family protein [Gluconacetobacter sacchari]|uniref:VOC family protein n=2 Tax=Gluconacetobacter sacchari TaxID=92759 RepID=A0A7W4I9L0_9PROT|nr:VOC family protein [Gluconacetobacter sacchari]MBB2158737.1 VOC family protein [Gluconacetobacter sacchari]